MPGEWQIKQEKPKSLEGQEDVAEIGQENIQERQKAFSDKEHIDEFVNQNEEEIKGLFDFAKVEDKVNSFKEKDQEDLTKTEQAYKDLYEMLTENTEHIG